MTINSDYLIIGLSAAGLHAAQTIRVLDPNATIGALDILPTTHNKCFFTSCNSGHKKLGDIQLRSDNWFIEHRIQRYQAEIISLDHHQNSAISRNNERFTYKKLLLATGTKARNFSIKDPKIFNYHTADDVHHLSQIVQQQSPQKALVIGGGLNGLELAHLLHRFHIAVTIIEQSPYLVSKHFSPHAQDWLLAYARKCFAVHLNTPINEIVLQKDVVVARNATHAYQGDILIDCRGVMPNTAWLPDAIHRNEKGYILVNKQQQTSCATIYAAGDCASYDAVPCSSHLWTDAAVQGIHAAYSMLDLSHKSPTITIGGETKFPDFPLYWRGRYEPAYESIIEKTDEYYCEIWHDKARKLHGFILIGTLKGAGELTQQFLRDKGLVS